MSGDDSARERPWERTVPAADRALYDLAGIGRAGGLGARPALLIIDVQYRTLGRERMPIDEAVRKTYPTACGDRGWRAVDQLVPLLSACREHGVPVVHAFVAEKTPATAGQLGAKVPAVLAVDSAGYQIAAEVAPLDGELLVPKGQSSAFFGTSLISSIVRHGVDTLLVAGCTTSGCVRATVVDAASFELHVAVVEDCVYDRSEFLHDVALFDMSRKYADVVTLETALAYVADGSRAEGTR